LRMDAGGMIGRADAPNGTPDSKADAKDLEVSTLAAQAANGIYVQELSAGGDLTIGQVDALTVTVDVNRVRFNSTTTNVQSTETLAALDDLTTTADGPIKVNVSGGSLTVNDGMDSDGVGVSADGIGDVLLRASALADFSTAIESEMGSIHICGDGVESDSVIRAGSDGSILIDSSRHITSAGLETESGNIIATAVTELSLLGGITSDSGSLLGHADSGLIVFDSVANVGGNILLTTAVNILMSPTSTAHANGDVVLSAGTSTNEGRIELGQLVGRNIALEASSDILDINGSLANITAEQLKLVADSNGNSNGHIGTATDALELAVQQLASTSFGGTHLLQLASGGDIVIGEVEPVTITGATSVINFNSTFASTSISQSTTVLSDISVVQPTNVGENAVTLILENGSVTITDGGDSDGLGIEVSDRGKVMVATLQTGDIALQTGISTADLGGMDGEIELHAAGWIDELASASGSGNSDAFLAANHLILSAGEYAHLHRVDVDELTARVERNGLLDSSWQQTNLNANERGDDFLEALEANRIATAQQNGVITEYDPAVADNLLSAVREDYADVERQFRFEDTYQRQYALFLQNTKSLQVNDVQAGTSNAPNVYIETIGSASDLNVEGVVSTSSESPAEGGIVLVAGNDLSLNGTLATQSEVSPGVLRQQLIHTIGRGSYMDADGNTQEAHLDAMKVDAGEGVPQGDFIQTTTEFVIRDQNFGLSAGSEDHRTHVLQRVVLQFGFGGESGFSTYIGYADGEVQQFEVAGQEGVRTKSLDQLDATNLQAIEAQPAGSATTGEFTRATAYRGDFLDANQNLHTRAIVRRAEDFFLFENAAAPDSRDIKDLTFQSFDILGVTALGAQGATEMPTDPPPVLPPPTVTFVVQEVDTRASELPQAELELTIPQEKKIEVAIYRVFYEDENYDGQADDQELPNPEEVSLAKDVEEGESAPGLKKGQRVRLEAIETDSGGSPTAEDIAKAKRQYLDDPTQPTGAYAIIEKGLDDEELVLDVFSIRDSEETKVEQAPLITDPDVKQSTNEQPVERGAEPDSQDEEKQEPDLDDSSLNESTDSGRFQKSDATLVAAALVFLRNRERQGQAGESKVESNLEITSVGLDRRTRRSRRLARLLGKRKQQD
ncbi:MAG: hypothetical protein AAF483_24455, partial [Planctomycetota bacterium]